MSRRERPRQRPKTELQLYRAQLREQALERRDRLMARSEAQLERQRGLRLAARQERQEALAEAREAMDALERGNARMELQRTDSGVWSGLAVGLGVAALVGVAGVLVYLLVRKQDGQVVGVQTVQGLGYTPPIIINGAGGVTAELAGSLQSLASSLEGPHGEWAGSLVKTYRLPSINDKTRPAIRVAQATDLPYEVSIRAVSPTGQFAAFSLSATELNQATGIPIGDNIILPVGHWQLMTLKPREVLYAKGSDATVVVSVTMNEAMARTRRR